LLHAIDERLAAYGFETNTGVKFVVVVDMRGRVVGEGVGAGKGGVSVGLREGEMKLVSNGSSAWCLGERANDIGKYRSVERCRRRM
jgi:hypothetical protein